MQRYFIETDNQLISGNDAHHIINVMRKKTGDKIIVCNSGVCFLSLIEIKQKEVYYTKLEELPSKIQLQVDIIQGLPKSNKVEEICKTATIFGAQTLIFTPMVRSIAKLSNEDNKIVRYQKIIKEAAELAHRTTLMKLEFKSSLKQINFAEYDLILLADELTRTQTINDYLASVGQGKIAVIIGPEGGIDQKERDYLETLKAKRITLGELILPTELAHIPILTIIYNKLNKSK